MSGWGPRESAPGTDPGPGPAFGSQRDPGSAAGAASAEDQAGTERPVDESSGAPGGSESTDSTAESESRLAAEPLPGDDRVSGSGDDPVAAALRERDEYKDALVRLQADFENYKKRMLKQQTEHLERAAGQLVEKLLPVLDAVDLALAHGAGEDLKQVTSTLFGALEREGLERIDAAGAPFDPTLHDAVAHEPAEGDGRQEVVEVMRAGYLWKGRVLRPAMVKVRG
jgi:molecular chaperone GrpE